MYDERSLIMATLQKSLRLPEEAVKEIEALASRSGKDFSGLARDLLIEAIKMRRCPGITFADGPSGRRARIAGTGIDVWEFIATFKGLDEDHDRLKESYHWLSGPQMRSALTFYSLYPDEVDAKIADNEQITEKKVLHRFPFLAVPAGKL
jgi:uncharacterized protein (DUF433 family)